MVSNQPQKKLSQKAGMQQRCFPRPFMDNLRPFQFRAPDEPHGLVGGLRTAGRDVAAPYWPPLPWVPPPPHPQPMGGLPPAVSADEDTDCFVLGEKLLKKQRRIRTRVDAGEPRNSYSAFSSLPNLCGVSGNAVRPSVGQANSLFSATQAFAGFPFHYLNQANSNNTNHSASASAGGRMLSELFGAHSKPVVAPGCEDRDSALATMGVLDKVTSSSVHSADTLNSVIRGPEPDNVLLRGILQGRKQRELLTMEEIEAARSLHNNNNSYKGSTTVTDSVDKDSADETTIVRDSSNSGSAEERCESEVEETMGSRPSSPDNHDPRKNLIENLVSVIRSSPTPNTGAPAVNGCKKRKLYLPQQHESRPNYDSPVEEEEGSTEPDNKISRLEADEDNHEPRQTEADEGGLQIDLSVRRPRSPDQSPARQSSPKVPTSTASPESNDASAYLLDYAQRLIRSQEAAQIRREVDMKNSAVDITEKLQLLRNLNLGSQLNDLEGLADVLKTEITASLAVIIDSVVLKFVQQRKLLSKQVEAAAEQLNRDISTQIMERARSPRGPKGPERHFPPGHPARFNGVPPPHGPLNLSPYPGNENINSLNLHHPRLPMYKPPHHALFPGGLPPFGGMVPVSQTSPYEPEQDEALPLVVTPKKGSSLQEAREARDLSRKKRHKVTDSRLTPRTVGRLLEEFPRYPLPGSIGSGSLSPRGSPPPQPLSLTHQPPRPPFPPPPQLIPVSLPTSVAIPNPSLHETSLLYQNYYGRGPSSPPERRDESPVAPSHPHPHPLLHPALLAASSPDSFSHFLHRAGGDPDRTSDCSPADTHFDGQPTLSFYSNEPFQSDHDRITEWEMLRFPFSSSEAHSSTLTPMHLRKAKLMFFFVRYPSSSVLKTFFPDIKFNKNNTAQLVKWFSNFREFYYIQMEKFARQTISEGVKSTDDITVTMEHDIIRCLNLHYNRNNHLEIPEHFRYVVEQTLKEFFKAIQEGKDTEQSWKKSIYKVIARLDESVPEYFKSPTFLEQLE
ncbi:unnamed protein product, partial [Meganyctiphanes norvegica]